MDDFSQSSVLSDASTIPLEIIDNEDQDFLDEITRVHVLYFGNVDQHTDRENAATESSIGDSDDDDDEIDIRIREDPDLGVQLSDIDNKENDIQSNFQDKTCGCVRLYGKPCSTVVDWDILLDYRRNCMETSKAELDIIIKIQLFHHRNNSTETSAKKHKTKEREKVRQQYVFNSQQVCRETFAFAHGINRKTVDSIALSLDKDGIIPRVHGNKGKSPKHALTLSDVKNVRKFLCTYANKYGLPLPGRLPNFRDEKALLLPSDKSKSEIHQDYMYVKSADELEYRKICLSEFKTIWLEQCPHILIMKPSTDLCHTCNSFTNSLMNSGNLTEEQKSTVLDDYKDHLDKVKVQRDQYRKLCDDSKKTFQNMPDEKKIRGQRPCSLEGTLHYSFDYAQQVHYPHYAQQVGPLFFKTQRKCQCFGVCSEGSGSQIFYLVDEAQHSNKGANTVTSMLHHHFTYLSYGETDVNLHMDNCSGQNKNNTVIGYGMWRVMNGLHRRIEFSLMEAGHTKFNPDWHFGLWKVKWRNTTAETINEIADSVSRSSKNGHNIPQLVDDEEKPVLFYDWATFLKKMFKPIPQLKTYHHFRLIMWQEARKQEKKIRGLMVDYKKRAERRREFYEKIKLDPAQFVRAYGRPCKINLDPAVAYAAESPQSMMPWQGQTDNMIDRFDVRAHLDYMPQTKIVAPPTLSKREEEEERWCNYESYRIIVENECAGLSEEQALHQIYIDEQFGNVDKSKEDEKKKLEGKKAAIGFVYEDSTPGGKEEDDSEDSDTDVEDVDLDITLDVDTLNNEQKRLLNECAQQYGMKDEDFVSMLQKDKEEAEEVKLARILEEEKAQFAGRKSRRERRAYKEKRLAGRKLSPPSYAARDSPKYEPYKRSSSSSKSRSRSPESKDKVLFITSFGGESDEEKIVVHGPSLPNPDKMETWSKKKKKKIKKKRSKSRSRSKSREKRERDNLKKIVRSKTDKDRKRRHSRSSSASSRSSISSGSSSSRSRSFSRSVSRSRSRSKKRSSSSRSRSRSSSYSSKSKSRSISPQKVAPPIKRYRRASLSSKSSGSESDHRPSYRDRYDRRDRHDRYNDKKDKYKDSRSTGHRSETKVTGNSTSALPQGSKLTPQEKLKRRMQAALSKSFKADKKAEVQRNIKSEQERIDREEDLRIRALELRRREREKRHRNASSSDDSSSGGSHDGKSPRRNRRSRSRSKERTSHR